VEEKAVFFTVNNVNGIAMDAGKWMITHDQFNLARALATVKQEYTYFVEAIRFWPDPAVMVGCKGHLRLLEPVQPSMGALPPPAMSHLAHPKELPGAAVPTTNTTTTPANSTT
jgi:hypothetical protein